MKLISLDLEMNQPSGKIIQVGAVIFSVKPDFRVFDKVRIYVNPQEQLSQEIMDLTGITQDQVDSGVSVQEAYEQLRSLAKNTFMNPVVWGSGTRNDSDVLYKQSGSSEPNFMGHRVIDAKTIYQSYRAFTNDKIRSGLARSMREYGLEFEGREHDALDDAYNTALFWYTMMRDFDKFHRISKIMGKR